MADKRISQLVERINIANNDVLPIVASGATTTNKVTVSTLQDWMQDNLDVGVTSVGLSMPSAFTVTNSPVTTSGNISVVGAGTVSQYIRGDGSLADFPQGGGGGGASVNYYLNGSVSQGTIGGIAYREINKTPILGTGTDFVAIADGYLASFITDAGDPGLLEIPGGNWNFETYFSASSAGGTPSFYIELYKVNSGGTATLIASNSATPELIAFGTTITPYFSALAVPTTSLTITDRLALRYYVARSGRTITMHTENSHLCQIITTFTTGLTALNGLTAQVQNFATGTSGSDFNISSSSSTHTFNLPNASDTARGVVSTGTQTFAGYKIFNGTIGVNNDLQLATVGTALNTFIKNINSTGLTSIGSNGFGFNNANNIYFSGSSKGGGVFAFSNTGTQIYTLQDASGTLAFTSQIPTNPVGGTGAQGRVAYWNGSGTITSDSLFQWNDTFKRLGIGRTPTVSLDVEGAGFFSTSVTAQQSNITADGAGVVLQGYVDNNLRIAVRGSGYNSGSRGGLLASTGDFSGQVTVSSNSGIIVGSNSRAFIRQTVGGDAEIGAPANGTLALFSNGSSVLSFIGTGAATFSSSVTANSTINGYLGTITTGQNPATSGTTPVNAMLNLTNNRGVGMYFGGSYAGNYAQWIQVSDTGNLGVNYPLLLNPNGGNVGIGTASPSQKLVVEGSAAILSVVDNRSFATGVGGAVYLFGNYRSAGDVTVAGYIQGSKVNSTDGDYGFDLVFGTQQYLGGVAERFRIMSTGILKSLPTYNNTTGVAANMQIDSNGFMSRSTVSSLRFKEEIEDWTGGLDVVMALKPRTFKYKKDYYDKADIDFLGLIAEEVSEVCPYLVDYENEDRTGQEENVRYANIVVPLIKAIQELKTEIDSLKNQMQ